MNHSAFLSTLLFSTLSFGAPHSYYIIVHGTWSRPFTWHMPGGSFYESIASVSQPGTVSFFYGQEKTIIMHELQVVKSSLIIFKNFIGLDYCFGKEF